MSARLSSAPGRTGEVLDLIDGTLRDLGTSPDAARFVPAGARTFQPGADDEAWDVIDAYTRADAIADGVLVPVPAEMAVSAGFCCPVALSAAAWEDCAAWTAGDAERKPALQDEDGRLWDVVWMASRAIRGATPDDDRVAFRLYRIPRAGLATEPAPAALAACAGPGDDGELVITIWLAGEDD